MLSNVHTPLQVVTAMYPSRCQCAHHRHSYREHAVVHFASIRGAARHAASCEFWTFSRAFGHFAGTFATALQQQLSITGASSARPFLPKRHGPLAISATQYGSESGGEMDPYGLTFCENRSVGMHCVDARQSARLRSNFSRARTRSFPFGRKWPRLRECGRAVLLLFRSVVDPSWAMNGVQRHACACWSRVCPPASRAAGTLHVLQRARIAAAGPFVSSVNRDWSYGIRALIGRACRYTVRVPDSPCASGLRSAVYSVDFAGPRGHSQYCAH